MSCTWKINKTFVDNAEDLDTVMPMYILLEYSYNYSMTSSSFWNYYRDEVNDAANEKVANDRTNNIKATKTKSLESKTKIIGKASANPNRLDKELVVS